MVTETQPASHRSCREREGGPAPVPAGCTPCLGQVRRAGGARRSRIPIPTQTISSWAGRPAPRAPGAAEEQPVRPASTLETLEARAPSPRRHAALTGISPRCGSSWNYLPPQRRAPPAPRSGGGRGAGGAERGILGTLVPSCARPRRGAAVPGPATRCRCHGPRATPGPGPAEPPRIPRPRPPSPGRAERLPQRRAPAPPPSRAEPAAGEARCFDTSSRQQHRLPWHRTAPSFCPVSGCWLTDRRGGHIGRPPPGVHL